MNEQQNLFETEPQPWQLDDQDDWLAARVAFAEAPYGPYDYSIPTQLEPNIRPGVRVNVPLGRGNRSVRGYCIDVLSAKHPDAASVNVARLKPILETVDQTPIIDSELLELASWISDYYLCPLGSVVETVIPPGIRDQAGTREVIFLALASELYGHLDELKTCLLYTSPSPRDATLSRMPSSA